jgi:hypothetical protein
MSEEGEFVGLEKMLKLILKKKRVKSCGLYSSVQNYWAYGLYPSSGVQKKQTEEHYVSETGSVSVLRCMGQDKTYSVRSVRRS